MFQSRTNQHDEEEVDQWGIIKNWFSDNQTDVVLIFGVILVALIGFGLGRLTATQATKEPVVIESQRASALNSIEQNVNQDNTKQNTNNEKNSSSADQISNAGSPEKGIIVASKNGTKYHWPWCSWAKRIKPENQVWFDSEIEAKAAGYEPCAAFNAQAPAGYKP
ncbi:MAG: hypothetical protein CO002_01440 [Candidatus Portnoybacteria bacterium CG_4_8_14_3_um_filter_44_10]|uniref:Ada DNA repair metal-binding domain-containing protein n=5 Tax=Candidatus Portnoyibacteriota TaxID=1817913 RepID=A0A2H0KQY4_9BACT|nr:MAG: hypothetical protein AUK17_01045 [Parcubacteria group bacterium CG2_30_44_18]PIQ74570.1 MAG: hypothetical protein COV85_01485 [Candidatus Portnoybacteria bacterium CG11_big_fil_rev_8_21_14_0_20_44_10]PIS16305.1 MAG: hypothetical protein COT61_04685 [Candidatus Portnoybacteria bacterium CG09_land_8_20_14_0_10_44_13]PIW75542.1 MAG: hypothetical protein CO002_01440 [Candidatus Portnoybacteria bacterium CG_4_8_14_3_um_filter_44_10]PIZ69748.1 MAG: hypothetical protein COY11_03985 [Candidatus